MTKDEYKDILFARNNVSALLKDMKSHDTAIWKYLPQREAANYAFNLRETKRVLDKMLLSYQQHGSTKE